MAGGEGAGLDIAAGSYNIFPVRAAVLVLVVGFHAVPALRHLAQGKPTPTPTHAKTD